MQAIIWSKSNCSYCVKAKEELTVHGIEYEERILSNGWTKEQLLEVVPNAQTVPQIFIEGIYIGDYTDLKDYLK